jgi:DNA-directed RNA polymerase specialized sigma24 family protein
MINQHLEMAIAELQKFIDSRPDAREVRKALAVKLVYQGYKYEEIQTILDVSVGSINLLEASLQGRWNLWTALKL